METASTEQQAEAQATEPAKEEKHAVPAQVLLIDLDNCPNQVEKLSLHIEEFTRVIVSYGGIEPNVPFGLVRLLATPIHEERLEVIAAGAGKNAADFALTFHAGLLVNEMPPNTVFTILSDDTGLDHAVHLLHDKGRIASRLSGKDQSVKEGAKPRDKSKPPKTKAPTSKTPASSDSSINDAAVKFSGEIQKSKKMPKSKKALINYIKSHFKGDQKLADSSDAIFKAMVKDGLITMDGDKVKYS